MDTDSAKTEASPREATAPARTGRQPPVVLTSAISLIQLQKQLKNVVNENFEFVAREMEPESSREAWRISNPSNNTSTAKICPTTPSSPNPKCQ
jgi:hypothetical protein